MTTSGGGKGSLALEPGRRIELLTCSLRGKSDRTTTIEYGLQRRNLRAFRWSTDDRDGRRTRDERAMLSRMEEEEFRQRSVAAAEKSAAAAEDAAGSAQVQAAASTYLEKATAIEHANLLAAGELVNETRALVAQTKFLAWSTALMAAATLVLALVTLLSG